MNPIEKKTVRACCSGSEEVFLQLCPKVIPINHIVPTHEFRGIIIEGGSLLHNATVQHETRMVQILIDLGISLDIKENRACQYGFDDILKVLLEAGADPFLCDRSGLAPIHWAAIKDFKRGVELLIHYGVNPNSRTFGSWTPMHLAARNGNLSVVEVLIKRRINANVLTLDSRTPIYEASAAGDDDGRSIARAETVAFLLENGGNPDTTDLRGRSPLHWACYYGSDRIALELIFARANVRCRDSEGITPLHLAALSGRQEVMSYLIRNKADVHAVDRYLRTPLHYACKLSSKLIVKFLLDSGANPDATDDRGDKPKDYVTGETASDINELLVKYSNQKKTRESK